MFVNDAFREVLEVVKYTDRLEDCGSPGTDTEEMRNNIIRVFPVKM